jgi:hypothetical protein
MPEKQYNSRRHCAGFEADLPFTRQIITTIQVLPAHNMGESVTPYQEKFKGLWDTGASASTIGTAIAARLALPVIGQREMYGAGGAYISQVYLAGLLLPNNVSIEHIALYGFESSPKFDMLIGMDIITMGDFLVSSHNGQVHFSFQIPSMGGITLSGIEKAVRRDGVLTVKSQTNIGTSRRNTPKIGRNEPCHCGSGKKYKHCHGKGA